MYTGEVDKPKPEQVEELLRQTTGLGLQLHKQMAKSADIGTSLQSSIGYYI